MNFELFFQGRGLPDHRRDLRRHLRVCDGLGHDLGRVQLEAKLQMVSEDKSIFISGEIGGRVGGVFLGPR